MGMALWSDRASVGLSKQVISSSNASKNIRRYKKRPSYSGTPPTKRNGPERHLEDNFQHFDATFTAVASDLEEKSEKYD